VLREALMGRNDAIGRRKRVGKKGAVREDPNNNFPARRLSSRHFPNKEREIVQQKNRKCRPRPGEGGVEKPRPRCFFLGDKVKGETDLRVGGQRDSTNLTRGLLVRGLSDMNLSPSEAKKKPPDLG